MAFNYAVNFFDPTAASDPQDAVIQAAMNAALAAWSNDLNGVGTLLVQLNVEPLGAPSLSSEYTLAEAGPTTTVADGTAPDGHALRQTAAINEMLTGNHAAATDITVTFNQQLLSSLVTASSPYALTTIFEHELLHGFGISGDRSEFGLLGVQESTFDAKSAVNAAGLDYFTGAIAESIYGGPVPLTTGVGAGSDFYHVGATGTAADPAVLRNDLIYPYSMPGQAITALDVGILADIGAPVSAAGYALINPNPTGTETVLNAAQPYAAVTDPTVGGTTQPGETVTVQTASGAVVGTAVASGSGNWSVRPAGLQDGVQALTASVNGQQIAAVPVNLDDGAVVAALYSQILGRPVDTATLPVARQQLYSGESVAAFTAGLATSKEAVGDLGALWQAVVGRAVSPGELSGAETALENGASQASLRAVLASSTEAANALGSAFQAAVGRAPTAAELPAGQTALASGASLAALRGALAGSAEASAKLQAIYPAALGRAVTGTELAADEQALASGSTLAGLQTALATSTEAANAINALFLTTVGRYPGLYSGVPAVEQALASGSSLAGLRQVLATSGEETTALTSLFQTVLGRNPTGTELPAVEQAIGSGGTLQAMKAALTSSTEFVARVNAAFQAAPGRPANTVEIAADQSDLSAIPAPQDPTIGLSGYPTVPVTPVTIAGSGPDLVYGLLNGGLANGLTFADAVVSAQPLAVQGAPIPNAFNHYAVPSVAGDTISGFNPQTDYIQIEASQASSFGAITLTAYQGATLATFGSNPRIELNGLAPSALTAANFRFV